MTEFKSNQSIIAVINQFQLPQGEVWIRGLARKFTGCIVFTYHEWCPANLGACPRPDS